MNADQLVAIVTAGCLAIGMIGGILGLTFRIGALSGKVDSFMTVSERDRSEIIKDIGRLEERHERHLEAHHGGNR